MIQVTNLLRPAIGRAFTKLRQNILNEKATAYLLIIGLHLLLVVWRYTEGVAFLISNLFIDDTYYYLNTAWNVRELGVVTFDGINETSGVHFLWFWLLVIFSIFSADKYSFLQLTYWLVSFLIIGTYPILLILGKHLIDSEWTTGLILLFGWFLLSAQNLYHFGSGMESVFHFPAIALFLHSFFYVIRSITSGNEPEQKYQLYFLATTILVIWARLDSVLFIAPFFVVLFILWIKIYVPVNGYRELLYFGNRMVILGGVAAILQIAFYLSTTGTVVPISGLVKVSRPLSDFAALIVNMGNMLFPFAPNRSFSGNIFFILLWIGSIAYLWIQFVRVKVQTRRLGIGVILLLGLSISLYVLVIHRQYSLYFRWYLSPVYLYWVLFVALFVARLPPKFDFTHKYKAVIDKPILYSVSGIAIICLAVSILLSPTVSFHPVIREALAIPGHTTWPTSDNEDKRISSLAVARWVLADWINNNLDESCVLASFNAGQIGYFSDNSVINLDGLVNNRYYLDHYLRQPEHFSDYLEEMGIDYIVDYDFYWATATVSSFDLIYELEEYTHTGGRTLKIVESTFGNCPRLESKQ